MEIVKNQKIILIRYSDFILPDTFESHIEIFNKLGYVWFGKMGRKPSTKLLDAAKKDQFYYIIFHKRLSSFLCRVSDIVYDKPSQGLPDYYSSLLFDRGINLTIYFKIVEYRKLSKNYLADFITFSSKQNSSITVNKSMSSFFLLNQQEILIYYDRLHEESWRQI